MSSEQFTFAGVPLIVPSAQVLSFVEDHDQFKPQNYFRIPNNGKLDGQDIYFDDYDRDPYRHMKIGSLYWPTGASNFAAGFFLVTSSDLEKLPGYDTLGFTDSLDTKGGIRSTINKDGYKAGKLVMQNTDIPFSAKMYMLPPRPLIQIVTPTYNDNVQLRGKIPMSHLEALWVLPLVDERYWWWWHTSGEMSLGTCTSWQGLFVELFKNMGYDLHQIAVSDIPLKYLYPNKIFKNQYNSLRVPLLLDTIAHSCNSRIISKFNGQILVQHVREGYDLDSYKSITPAGVAAGGYMSLHSTNKLEFENQFPSGSPLSKSSTVAGKLANVVRDTAGVIPAISTFIVNNKKIYIDVIGRSETIEDSLKRSDGVWPLSEYGDDTLNTQSIETISPDGSLDSITQGTLGYFYDTTEYNTGAPSITSRTVNHRGINTTSIPYKDGDYLLDTKSGIRYGPRSNGSWGDGVNGVSNLSKYFRIKASSYKANIKQCLDTAQKPANKTDKEFNDNQLKEYAQTYAGDWSLFQLADKDITLNGCVPVEQTSLIGHIEFNITEGGSFTRVVRPPYNDTVQDLYIESYLGDEAGCDSDTYPCGSCKGMQSDESTFSPLIGRGIPENFLPSSPIKVAGQAVSNSYVVTPQSLLADYPWYHKPPYVAKFCLGSATGTAALDYHFLVAGEISVYWDGQKVASRKINGTRPRINNCSDYKGRISFGKTTKTPTYAIVVVDTTDNTPSATDSNTFKKQNWAVNMRCVDSQPFPAPLDLYCADSAKLNEVPSVILLGMFTPPQSYVPGQAYGSYTTTTICDGASPASNFKCNGTDAYIPDNLALTFETPSSECSYLISTVINLQKSTTGGGWSGILDGFGPLKKLVIANLRLSGNEGGATIRILDILDSNKELVSVNTPVCVTSSPFKIQFLGGNLDLIACSGTTTKIIIKEA